jgi:hypothetical protein
MTTPNQSPQFYDAPQSYQFYSQPDANTKIVPAPTSTPSASRPNVVQRAWNAVPAQNPVARSRISAGVFNNRSVVFNAWIVAMILIGFDEWHNLGILPRPARLWDTTIVYGLLTMLGFVDIMVPIANALAVGYTIALLYQYYNGNLTPSSNTGTSS